MDKFSISAIPTSGWENHDACILAFDAEELKPSYHGNVIILDCKKFAIDEANSSKNWREAFGSNEEPPQGALITVNLGYKARAITPYFE